MEMKGKVLGLDLGTTSVGWALIEAEFDEDGRQTGEHGIIATGVRIFEAGLAQDKGGQKSRNVERRTARAARRSHQRRRRRKAQLRKILARHGLLPDETESFEQLIRRDPYELRATALDQRLELHEFGRALMHLNQRRGFQSNRKSGKDKEHGKLIAEIVSLREDITKSGARTLGEYLHRLGVERSNDLLAGKLRLRKRHTDRAMYRQEFEAIWDRQSREHTALQDAQLKLAVQEALFNQRDFEVTDERRERVLASAMRARQARGLPSDSGVRRANLWRSPTIGKCDLEPKEPRCPRNHWVAQRFRILKEVNNLRVIEADGATRTLSQDERGMLIQHLSDRRDETFAKLRDLLGLDESARFNLEAGGRPKLKGNSVEAAIAQAFGRQKWNAFGEASRQHWRDRVLHEEDEFALAQELVRAGMDPAKAAKLAETDPGGAMSHYSLKAMENLLVYMEQGDDEYTARQRTYGEVVSDEVHSFLPPTPDLPNPLVRRALVETRKVVNAILREYGLPTRIIVEMARDFSLVGRKREEHMKRQRGREAERDQARVKLEEEFGMAVASRADVERYLLWKEQGACCPYTGDSIPMRQLFTPDVQVDHILPRWRSMDDSFTNKVLCYSGANLEKGDRTPFEYLGGDQEGFDRMLSIVKNSSMSYRKRELFRQEELNADEAPLRQLNDTRYLSTEVRKYLNLLYPEGLRVGEKAVGSSRGQLTAELRREWGLNSVLGISETMKSRDDHRHHAVDAIVVALTTRAKLKRYADIWSGGDAGLPRRAVGADAARRFPDPWSGFRSDVVEHVRRIVVSHRANRKLSGALHEATYYGATDNPEVYVYRMAVDRLTGPMVAKICDPVARGVVEARLAAVGWDGRSSALPKGWCAVPLEMPSRQRLRRLRLVKTIKQTHAFWSDPAAEPFRFAILGNNHHLEVLAAESADGEEEVKFKVVSMMDAVTRVRKLGLPAVQKQHGVGTKLVMALHIGDSVLVQDPAAEEEVVAVVQKMSQTPGDERSIDLSFRRATDARPAAEAAKAPFARVRSARAWKNLVVRPVQVDPLGHIGMIRDGRA
jgi:CRISPR-associated endonuclease Csn1